jgi:hypothetical protein
MNRKYYFYKYYQNVIISLFKKGVPLFCQTGFLCVYYDVYEYTWLHIRPYLLQPLEQYLSKSNTSTYCWPQKCRYFMSTTLSLCVCYNLYVLKQLNTQMDYSPLVRCSLGATPLRIMTFSVTTLTVTKIWDWIYLLGAMRKPKTLSRLKLSIMKFIIMAFTIMTFAKLTT